MPKAVQVLQTLDLSYNQIQDRGVGSGLVIFLEWYGLRSRVTLLNFRVLGTTTQTPKTHENKGSVNSKRQQTLSQETCWRLYPQLSSLVGEL